MNIQQSITKRYGVDFLHIQDEFRRHSSASAVFGSFLSLFSSPVFFLEDLPAISLKYIMMAGAIFLIFSFLPDITRFFCNAFKLHSINALSHSFFGALFFSGLLMLAPFPFDIWKMPLLISGFLGYLFHLFIDSAESAIEWWVSSLQKLFSTPLFTSMERHARGADMDKKDKNET